ncbi:uncharacterized protein LY89DRAFT_674090 [Mollisia scopiformis]|uniref:Yeast cell wall synthesis Kre9/Knh1-like N-terminal domain-containing protein n=1 Tax=Mollisia scopiformis TaxID=149040 RepID=A0A194WV90_MOLSC|nr:uncharacterized protein LY89DRAFT_674090 [Mollisia scopiformis]KUJ11507.1 hypothetical protein LY89DRAFT_674090 [Mollisia scopiformis]
MSILFLFWVAVTVASIVNAAEFTMTASQYVGVKTGTPFDITWADATGPVTLLLKNGAANNLQTVETIAFRHQKQHWHLARMLSRSTTVEDRTIAYSLHWRDQRQQAQAQSLANHQSLNLSQRQTAAPTPSGHSGLSTGSKAAIGVGVTFGVLLFAAFGAFAFWYGKRAASRKNNDSGAITNDKAELGSGVPRRRELEDTSIPLNDEEKSELDRRRRAAELEAGSSPISPVETVTERAELEALRERGNAPIEMD